MPENRLPGEPEQPEVPERTTIFACPQCHELVSLPAKHRGKLLKCPLCGKRIQVPEDEQRN